jgi:anti-sigma factor ChrR (cupin superfamily)
VNSEIVDGQCNQVELVAVYALQALPSSDLAALEAHISTCPICQAELAELQSIVNSLAGCPTDVLQPSESLRERLAQRIAAETGAAPCVPEVTDWLEQQWEQAAPGLSYKLLATDWERDRVSMLVRLAPGVDYPAHRHAGVEELHLLDGELWIDERKLYPGDYNRAEPGTADKRVWTETGCTCVLITSSRDSLS